jgi:hypothetical protein
VDALVAQIEADPGVPVRRSRTAQTVICTEYARKLSVKASSPVTDCRPCSLHPSRKLRRLESSTGQHVRKGTLTQYQRTVVVWLVAACRDVVDLSGLTPGNIRLSPRLITGMVLASGRTHIGARVGRSQVWGRSLALQEDCGQDFFEQFSPVGSGS